MAKAEKEKKKNQSKGRPSQKMDPKRKAVIVKYSGMVVAFVAAMCLLSAVSYMFTWTSDAAQVGELHNSGSRLGATIGSFLVRDCLGLASYAFIGLLGFVAYYMFTGKKPVRLIYTTVVVAAGAVVAASMLSYFGSLFGGDTLFGGGLGGRMGFAINAFFVDSIGRIMSFCLIVLAVVLWLLVASSRFADWFATAFEKKTPEPSLGDETVEGEPGPSDIFGEPDDESYDPVSEPVTDPATVPVTAPEAVAEESAPSAPAPVEMPLEGEDGIPVVDGGTSVPEATGSDVIVVKGPDTDITEDLPPFDCREGLENFKAPSLDLLKDYSSMIHRVSPTEIDVNNNKIRSTLLSFKIQVDHVEAVVGPTVTLYKVFLAAGMKSASVKNVESDIAMSLCASSVRVVNLKDSVGIEVPNDTKSVVPLKSMFNDPAFRNSKAELPVAIGYTITQDVKVFDLADAPHLLVAGATKQGKSVGLNVIVTSLLYSKHPSELKLVFIDPKMVEFSAYAKLIKHYLAVLPGSTSPEDEAENAIVKDPKKAEMVLRSLCEEMDQRYKLLSKAGVNQLKDYNKKYSERHLLPTDGHHFLPYIVVVIDEYADLIMTSGGGQDSKAQARSIASSVIRLAQKGRAAGINVIIATQRPSVDVITGLIKANFPTRIAFKVSSRVDSSTILDSPGAEKLIGRGDMLYYQGVNMERVQCALVETDEIISVTKFIGSQNGYKEHYNTPYYLPEPPSDGSDSDGIGGAVNMSQLDENFEEAARMVVLNQKGSTSDLQRRLGMGYSRAGKVMDQLEAAGIVSAQVGSKPRDVLVKDFAELQPILDAFLNK